MSKAAIAQAFEVVTVRQVANAVGCDRRTVMAVRDHGRVSRTVVGRAIGQALAAMSGVSVSAIMAPDGDDPPAEVVETETPAALDPTEPGEPDEYMALAGKRIEDWKIARQNRIAKERENALLAGDLVDLASVTARISQAGVAFRSGQAAARRSIEAVCCDGCREAPGTGSPGRRQAARAPAAPPDHGGLRTPCRPASGSGSRESWNDHS